MNRRTLSLLLICFAGCIVLVAGLIIASGLLRDRRSTFVRTFPPHPVMEGDSIVLSHNSFYLAGGSRDVIYLGNYTAPLRMLVVNLNSCDTQLVRLSIPGIDQIKFRALRLQVDSPYYYLSDGVVPKLYRGDVNSGSGGMYLSDSVYFRDRVVLLGGAVVMKSYSGRTGENILGKMMPWSPYLYFRDDVLKKQLDGVFCTDGMLRYDAASARLVYTYYYRNGFVVMDTALRVLYEGETLDTVRRVRFTVASTASGQSLSSPPYFVNQASAISGHDIFIQSAELARNEHRDAFSLASVVDVFDAGSGDYRFSFYLYHFRGKKRVNEFMVFDDRLVARYGNVLRVHELRARYFPP